MEKGESLTVVMATWKQSEWIGQAIESLFAQGDVMKELVIAPVKGDHKTVGVVLPYYRTHKHRMFTGATVDTPNLWKQRQTGLGWALGDPYPTPYLCFFDSDDVMLPGWLDRGLKVAKEISSRGKIPIVGPSYRMVDEKLKPLQDVILPEFSMEQMMGGSIIPDFSITTTENLKIAFEAGCKMAKDNYTPQYSMYCTWLEMLTRFDCEVKLLPEIGFLYRQHKGGMHNSFKSSKRASKANTEMVHKIARNYFPKLGDGSMTKDGMSR